MNTEITEPARQMAADLANAEADDGIAYGTNIENPGIDPAYKALARLCARTIEREARMQADMAEIAEQADGARTTGPAWDSDALANIRTIAARWQVEADPLVEAIKAGDFATLDGIEQEKADELRAELDKLGYVIAKRGIALGAAK